MGATAHLGIRFGEYDATIAIADSTLQGADRLEAVTVGAVAPDGAGGRRSRHRLGRPRAAAIVKVRPKARVIGIDADEDDAGGGEAAAARQDQTPSADDFELDQNPAL